MASQERNMIGRIKTVPQIMGETLHSYIKDQVFISLPAIVTKTDDYESKQTVDVKPLLGTIYPDGDIVDPVNLKNLFVKLPSGGGFDICIPIKVGDLVTLHWSHKSLDNFLASSGGQANNDLNNFLSRRDCYVMHGFGTRSNNQSPSATNFIIRGDNSETVITPSGDITTDCNSITINCKTATLNAETSVDVNTPITTFSTDVQINGKLDVVGEVSSEAGMRAPFYGTATGLGGSMTIADIQVLNNVTINGKSVIGHDHNNGANTPF